MREIKLSRRFLPLIQLIPAAVVAAMVLLTLPHTAPVLAAVPERLEAVQEAAGEAAADETTDEDEPALPYEDGIYTGSSRGYGGKVSVQVTMENGRITDLQILSAKHETSNFLRRASRLLSMVMDAQTWEVDAVSEATYTSRGILGAIQNALTGEVINNPLPPQPKPAEPLVEEVFETPSAYRDGVYTATAEGFGGPITVQVTVEGDVIQDITVVSHEGETASYFAKARRVISAILETGTPEGVDAVSGATYSSTGLLNAVKQALAKAAAGTSAEEPAVSAEPGDGETEPESPAASEETPAEPVQPPTVEVVQPEEREPFQWAKDVWELLFPEEKTVAESTSGPEFFAQPTTEDAPESADGEVAQPEQAEETEGAGE